MSDQTGHWDGDFWVSASGYRVARRWVDKYQSLFGPLAQDPDEGHGDAECDDLVARLMAKFTGAGGTFSTWKERHAFIIFAGIGYLDVKSSDDVPPCPEFFLTEQQYVTSGLVMGRAAAKIEEAGPGLKTYLAIFAAGGISITGILKVFGIAV